MILCRQPSMGCQPASLLAGIGTETHRSLPHASPPHLPACKTRNRGQCSWLVCVQFCGHKHRTIICIVIIIFTASAQHALPAGGGKYLVTFFFRCAFKVAPWTIVSLKAKASHSSPVAGMCSVEWCKEFVSSFLQNWRSSAEEVGNKNKRKKKIAFGFVVVYFHPPARSVVCLLEIKGKAAR